MTVIRSLIVLGAATAMSACATTSTRPQPPPEAEVSTGTDCAVFAAIAREHYNFAEVAPPPLWADVEEEDGGRYFVQCDWPRMGVPMSGETYDPDAAGPGGLSWVRFERPQYMGTRALVRTALVHGPLAGAGYQCEVVSGVVGWSVTRCRSTWVS